VPNLRISEGGRQVLHQIERDVVTIGRAPSNTITIHDGQASKEHCRIEQAGDRWKLIDLESKNGTQVNGKFCNKAWLNHGDMIEIGKTEIRFGVERTVRRAPQRSRTAVRTQPQPDEEGEERAQRPRRYKKSATDRLMVIGLIVVIGVVILYVAGRVGLLTQRDEFNLGLLKNADKMKSNDQWEEALAYLKANVDPDGNAAPKVYDEINTLRDGVVSFRRNRANEAAATLVSKLTRRIGAYHSGKEKATARSILELCERLKTEYANTEGTKSARELYPAWFAGKVPKRAADLIGTGDQLQNDWNEALAKALDYEKEWRFREARETVLRFVSAREPIMSSRDLQRFKRERDQKLAAINLKADGIYRAQERRAGALAKSKKYDQAVAIYRRVIETFGLDIYVRKSQAEIDRLKALKAGG
jgi:pSer/pThr/pTyr-binding forkhead associated (FHA) protein